MYRMFERWSPYSYKNSPEMYEDDPCDEEPVSWDILSCLWHCARLATPMGSEGGPKSYAGMAKYYDKGLGCVFHHRGRIIIV